MKTVSILLFATLALMLTGLPAVNGSLSSSYAATITEETGATAPNPESEFAEMDLDSPPPQGKPAAAGVAPQVPSSRRFPQCGFCDERPDRMRRGNRGHMMGPKGKRCGPRMGRHGKSTLHRGTRFGGPRGERKGGIAAMKILRHAEELDLNEQQVTQLEELALDARKQLVDLHAAIEKGKLELEEQIRSNSDDITTIKKHLNSLAQTRVDVQELKLRNWIAVKKILTDDQKEMIQKKHPRMGRILD
jgi:Spy/CpxP family protein refolding chaperone